MFEYRKVGLVVTLGWMRFFPLNSFAQKFASEHIADVSMNARRRKAQRFGDLGNRFWSLSDDVENFLFSPVWQKSIFLDLCPRDRYSCLLDV